MTYLISHWHFVWYQSSARPIWMQSCEQSWTCETYSEDGRGDTCTPMFCREPQKVSKNSCWFSSFIYFFLHFEHLFCAHMSQINTIFACGLFCIFLSRYIGLQVSPLPSFLVCLSHRHTQVDAVSQQPSDLPWGHWQNKSTFKTDLLILCDQKEKKPPTGKPQRTFNTVRSSKV